MTEAVILIHGLGRSHLSFLKMAKQLKNKGYLVYNASYPSTKQKIQDSSESYINQALESLSAQKISKIHFVTHSLGGILVRYYLSKHEINNLGKIVMLAPPNKGSHIAQAYHDKFWFKWATGPAGQQLLVEDNPFLDGLEPIETEVAVLMGNRSLEPWFNHVFNDLDHLEHDGKVSIESAKLDNMSKFEIIDTAHTMIMNNPKVMSQVLDFLAQ